ncbi:hypothetical protein [Sphingobacterium cavernae]|uniref:hypothetical protein n=1 Tax=Sphingobacterium cavernae TaxID=2592657 RepID=UPI00122FE557|nr:hypothetical protein [Sphingobacterium cavernae]
MKQTFINTLNKLEESNLIEFIDRDRGQLENYETRPEVKFPCALIKVNQPRRENLNPLMQRVTQTIQIRIAFERYIEHNNLNSAQRLEKSLAYYDTIESVLGLFQGLKLGNTYKWECISIIDEDNRNFDIVRLTFTTGKVEEF